MHPRKSEFLFYIPENLPSNPYFYLGLSERERGRKKEGEKTREGRKECCDLWENEKAKTLVSHSHFSFKFKSFCSFPMAITGINLTALVRRLLQKDALKMHFYNTIRGAPTIDNFHHVFCMLFNVHILIL